jgi:uncharacterized phage protein gp47/JayE
MIDPGRPFTRPFGDVVGALEDRLRNGVEQPATLTLTFQPAVSSYDLPAALESVTTVSGLVGQQFYVFTAGADYRVDANRLVWLDAAQPGGPAPLKPDPGTPVSVDYVYREPPSGLTDLNAGSVAGTLARAFARELSLLYEQMNEAYRRAFIDTASGSALDNVVALLHVTRNAAVAATGVVTFSRKSPADKTYLIKAGTKVADKSGRVFLTLDDATIPPDTPLEEFATATAGVVKTTRPIAELVGVWKRAVPPDPSAKLTTDDKFGNDLQTISLKPPTQAANTDDLRIRYKPLSTDVRIRAQNPGPDGNVQANTITVMPTPPPGVDGVTNARETSGGADPESDARLRDRAKHELARAGNATLDAIKYAVLAVPGMSGVEVIDRSVDSSVPLGEVRVRYAVAVNDTVSIDAVRQAIDKTRAAGILAVPDTVSAVTVSGAFVVIPSGPALPSDSASSFITKVASAAGALPIGAPLGVRKLTALAYGITGIADVAEAQLRFSRPDPNNPGATLQGAVTDPFPVARTEIVRLDPANLRVIVLRGFAVTAVDAGTGPVARVITLQLLDTNGTPVAFVDYGLDVDVAINAFSKASPNDPPTQLAKPRQTVRFTGGSTGKFNVAVTDLANFNAATQKPQLDLVVSAAAYPALAPATAHTNWP